MRLFIDKSFLASISGQAGVFLVDCLSFISKSKKIIKVHALLSALLFSVSPLGYMYSPAILGSDGDTLDIRRRKEAGDDPTLTGMQ